MHVFLLGAPPQTWGSLPVLLSAEDGKPPPTLRRCGFFVLVTNDHGYGPDDWWLPRWQKQNKTGCYAEYKCDKLTRQR